jgi:hypothetical protein
MVRRGSATTWLCLFVIAVVVTTYTSVALARPRSNIGNSNINRQSTRDYLGDELRTLRAFVGRLPNAQWRVDRVIRQVHRGCMGAALGVPAQDELFVTREILLITTASVDRAEAGVTRTFFHATAGLKWRSRAIIRSISVMRHTFALQSAIVPPNICAEIRSWRRNGFQSVPRGMVKFVRRAGGVSAAPVDTPRLLIRYERGNENGILRRIGLLRYSVNRELPKIVDSASRRIDSILGLVAQTSMGSGDVH